MPKSSPLSALEIVREALWCLEEVGHRMKAVTVKQSLPKGALSLAFLDIDSFSRLTMPKGTLLAMRLGGDVVRTEYPYEALRRTDGAMYLARHSGKNRVISA